MEGEPPLFLDGSTPSVMSSSSVCSEFMNYCLFEPFCFAANYLEREGR